MIPGGNLLGMALRLITPQTIIYFQSIGRTLDVRGIYTTTYGQPFYITDCSVQAINTDRYEQLGLDFQKNYVALYVQRDAVSLQRGENGSGDKFLFAGKIYQLMSNNRWKPIDGWDSAVAIEIGDGVPIDDNILMDIDESILVDSANDILRSA